ncbi:hypothetical protein QNI16_23740 [Cytophagaceae bacterium YF14B1]|uniref:Uncharacterized protein n=1 Tax=Xanthocytophaga flava TaxID=3048013 RepID=A0AAE3QRE3_9BACT|nr:hypothetical protein [Xanthocytophaga flavus]MDJ1483531.1 hypothetical protein [Xanthocytophaga flavus]
MQIHTLTISNTEGGLTDLHICTDPGMPATAGLWITDVNYIMLGNDRWLEWNEIYGHSEKQKSFLAKVEKHSLQDIAPNISMTSPLRNS